MKGEITRKILEKLAETALNIGDLFDVFLTVGYGASRSKFERALALKKRQRSKQSTEKELRRQIKQQYYNMLYRLRADGLIEEKPKEKGNLFTLTRRGKEKLSFLKKLKQLPKPNYPKEGSTAFLIVMFDIPERERRKRDWLRMVLRHLNLRMIQKSVWIGKTKIPKALIDDLAALRLTEFVHVVEVTKAGSITQAL